MTKDSIYKVDVLMDFEKSICYFQKQAGLQINIVGAPPLPLIGYLFHCLSRGKSVQRKPALLRCG